ncbi:MAG: hypothetical protein HQK53_12060 [Oligoflexia bacterium]|nr:hypothetical protein [Oligoflexia bacterium]
MKKFLLIAIILCLSITFITTAYFAPNMLYYLVLQGYDFSSYYKVENIARFLSPRKVTVQKKTGTYAEGVDEKYWHSFHIRDYKIFLPLGHPFINVGPIINFEDNSVYTQLGMQFNSQQDRLLVEVLFNKGVKFRNDFYRQKIFTIPVVQSIIEKISSTNLWRDLFSKDLEFISSDKDFVSEVKSCLGAKKAEGDRDSAKECSFVYRNYLNVALFFSKLKLVASIPYSELIYNLYLLAMRAQYISSLQNNFDNFFYDEKNERALVVTGVQENVYQDWLVLSLIEGMVESYTVRYVPENLLSCEIFERMLASVHYSAASKGETESIYRQFVELPYNLKKDQTGMFYLFSAWSHNIDDKELLKETIKFLEKGSGNLAKLRPLYSYAYKKYGIDFSTKREISSLKDADENKQDEILKEKIEEEKNKTVEGIDGTVATDGTAGTDGTDGADGTSDDNKFASPEERFKFHLQKINDRELAREEAKEKAKEKASSLASEEDKNKRQQKSKEDMSAAGDDDDEINSKEQTID